MVSYKNTGGYIVDSHNLCYTYSSRAIFSQFFAFLEAFSQKSPPPHTTTKINLNKYNPNYTPNNSHSSLSLNKLTPAILSHTIIHPLTHTYSPKMHLYPDPIHNLFPHSTTIAIHSFI